MKKKTKFIAIWILPLGLLSFFIHPFGAVKQVASNRPLFAGAEIDRETAASFARSCQDCHSERTVWPWYSYVPVASWLLEKDVRLGRRYMNLSRWNEYTQDERQAYLALIAAAVRNGQMPPRGFVLLHREARLSTEEQKRISHWARSERRRLRVSAVQLAPAGQAR
jgi:hypothetical protein